MADPIAAALGNLAAHLKHEYPTLKPESAFIKWYVEMRFGKHPHGVELTYTDGPNDLGIDYCVKTPVGYLVLQSKYSANHANGSLAPSDVVSFQSVHRHLTGSTTAIEFSEWKAKAGGTTRKLLYQKIRSAAEAGKSVRFVMITTKEHPSITPHELRIDARPEIAYLWSLFEEGFSAPYPELVLTLRHGTWTKLPQGKLLTAQTRIADVLRVMHQHAAEGIPPSRLFIQNVRSYLGTKPISKAIIKSYQSSPSTFLAKHNGIYLVASSVKKSQGQESWALTFPSVVNGAQTLMALFDGVPETKFNSASVLLRVLEAPDKQFRDQVIAATNSQNGMDLAALLAHHPALAEIARRLDAYSVFLERQQKSWLNEYRAQLQQHRRITVKQLIQWTRACSSDAELGSLRSKVARFLEPSNADATLTPLAKSKSGPAANQLIVAVTMGLLARKIPAQLGRIVKGGSATKVAQRLKADAKIASILLTHLFCNAVGSADLTMHKCSHALVKGREASATAELLHIVRRMLEQLRMGALENDLDVSNYCKSDPLLSSMANELLAGGVKSELRAALLAWASGETKA
jgi:hypothetical protein